MKKLVCIATFTMILFSCQNQAQPKKSETNMTTPEVIKENIYQFKVEDLSGKVFDFATLKGNSTAPNHRR